MIFHKIRKGVHGCVSDPCWGPVNSEIRRSMDVATTDVEHSAIYGCRYNQWTGALGDLWMSPQLQNDKTLLNVAVVQVGPKTFEKG